MLSSMYNAITQTIPRLVFPTILNGYAALKGWLVGNPEAPSASEFVVETAKTAGIEAARTGGYEVVGHLPGGHLVVDVGADLLRNGSTTKETIRESVVTTVCQAAVTAVVPFPLNIPANVAVGVGVKKGNYMLTQYENGVSQQNGVQRLMKDPNYKGFNHNLVDVTASMEFTDLRKSFVAVCA